MNKNLIHKKIVEGEDQRLGDGGIKGQNDQLNLLLQKYYAEQNSEARSLIACHYVAECFRVQPEDKYEYEYCEYKNKFEKLINDYWGDIILDVLSETENKFNQDYFTSEDKKDIPKKMCALKTEYESYDKFKTLKSCDDYKFTKDGDDVYIVEHAQFNKNDYKNNSYKGRPPYNKIHDIKDDIARGVRRRKWECLHKIKYDKNYVLYPETLVSFLKTLRRNDIDSPEKRKMFLEFLQSNKLNIQDFNSEVICEIINLVYFGRYTNINEWFDFLRLNKKYDLSPSVLFKCASKAQQSGSWFQEIYYYSDEYIEQLNRFGTKYINGLGDSSKKWWIKSDDLKLNNDDIYRPEPSQCGKFDHESYYSRLNYEFNRWKADDVKKVLSFASNYEWPDPMKNKQDYDKEVNCFFGLLVCLFDNLTPDKKIVIQSAREIFDFVNKNMSHVKLPINKIEKYKNGKKLFEVLKKYFVSIVQNDQDGSIEMKIDYSGLFNDFIKDKFDNDKNIKYNSLDELSKARENLIAEFVKYRKKIGIDFSDDVVQTLFLNANSVVMILGFSHTERNIVKTPEEFKRYVAIINRLTKNRLPLRTFFMISSPIADNTVSISDMLNFMSEHAETTYDMSFSRLYYYVFGKIKEDTKWTYDNIINLLSYSKNFSKKDRNFEWDLRNHFLDLLGYIFKNVDKNVNIQFWQDIFCWINENMPHIYFSEELLKKHGYRLTSMCEWNGVYLHATAGKIEVSHDYGYVKEQFEFFVWSYFRVTAKYVKFWNIKAKDYENLKTDKFKSLSEIKSACDLLMNQFFQKHSGDITSICIQDKLRSELKVQLCSSYAMQDFIRSIEPGIIKSSNYLHDFVGYVNSINLKKVSAFTDDIEYAADFVSDNSLSIDEAGSFLSCFCAHGYLYPSALLKFCKKIKLGEKWNFTRIHSFLSFLDSSFDLPTFWKDKYEKQAEALFSLLNIFCEKDNIEWLSNEYDITLTEAASYIFSLLSSKLYKVRFKDLFNKVDKFKNAVLLKNNLKKMNLSLAEINLSINTSSILSKKTKKEKINGVVNKLDEKNKNILKNKMKHWLQISKQENNKERKLKENLEQEQRNIENSKNLSNIGIKNSMIKLEENKETEENKKKIGGGINKNNKIIINNEKENIQKNNGIKTKEKEERSKEKEIQAKKDNNNCYKGKGFGNFNRQTKNNLRNDKK